MWKQDREVLNILKIVCMHLQLPTWMPGDLPAIPRWCSIGTAVAYIMTSKSKQGVLYKTYANYKICSSNVKRGIMYLSNKVLYTICNIRQQPLEIHTHKGLAKWLHGHTPTPCVYRCTQLGPIPGSCPCAFLQQALASRTPHVLIDFSTSTHGRRIIKYVLERKY